MTITAEPAGLAEMKQFTRATWAAGDFGESPGADCGEWASGSSNAWASAKMSGCLMSPAAQATRRSEPRRPGAGGRSRSDP